MVQLLLLLQHEHLSILDDCSTIVRTGAAALAAQQLRLRQLLRSWQHGRPTAEATANLNQKQPQASYSCLPLDQFLTWRPCLAAMALLQRPSAQGEPAQQAALHWCSCAAGQLLPAPRNQDALTVLLLC
jgi:hypothetical protein